MGDNKTWLQLRMECNKKKWDSLPQWLKDKWSREPRDTSNNN